MKYIACASAVFTLTFCQQPIQDASTVLKQSKSIVIKPCGSQGKDTRISISSPLNTAFADMDALIVNTWTILGVKTINRSLIGFKTNLNKDIQVDSVFLKLHLISKTLFDHTYIGNSGENALYVQRITSDWKEHEVNWINQPTFTHKNQVEVPAIFEKSEGVVSINVTKLFQDHLAEAKTGNEMGLYIRMKSEEVYKKVYFASSDNTDFDKHPELIVYYTE